MEGRGQEGDPRNGELTRRSRTPAPGAAPEGSSVAADVPQSEVGLQVDASEREFRELVAQLEESITELIEFDELGGYERRIRREMDEIEQRIRHVIRRWQTFIPQSPEQMGMIDQRDVIDLRITQLGQISLFPRLFRPLKWLNDVGLPLMHHPRIRITEEHVNADNGNPLLCIICQRVFQVGQTARQLECGHNSHQSCLYATARGRGCPGCGTILFRRVRQLPRPQRWTVGDLVPPPLMAGTSISISGDHISDNNSITSTCPICHVDFEFGEDANELNCGHIHHPNCISAWLPVRNNCPVCRAEL